ncbi:MAG: M14 family metallopeptidase [Pseudomonadota bacterium]|nr:M14 family metallopeptidase [Pseudomonadota bacterium]
MEQRFDRFYRYPELTEILKGFTARKPELFSLESAGQSFEGRDIWIVTATHAATGAAADKPAFWIDGNIHAAELTASTACLHYLHHLEQGYGKDPEVTRLLDTRAFYICPRINPDGAEWALADQPKYIRSSTRPYPFDEEPVDGLNVEDVDGDGRILTMRIPDPNGGYKANPEDPRLMTPRDPVESGGEYWRVIPEGRLVNYDGVEIRVNRDKQGIDLNRNFPSGWRQEFQQLGAGPYPTSEPEVRAIVDFIVRHPNIGAGVSFHTHSGVILRPFSSEPDENMPAEDLWLYKLFGKKSTELTGYPNISIFHDFKYHPKQVITGGFDWIYEHLGQFFWTVEIWAPVKEAGVQDYHFIDWYREHPPEDDLKLIAWSDRELAGEGYVSWYPFDHPQLGAVELGGWNKLATFRNPPAKYLEREVKRFPAWLTWQALTLPRLELLSATAERLGPDTWRVRIAVQNTGYLPAYVTKRALERKVVRGVVYEIELPSGTTLAAGKARVEGGQLEGRASKATLQAFLPNLDLTGDRGQCEWTVRAAPGTVVTLAARHERAGRASAKVTLS